MSPLLALAIATGLMAVAFVATGITLYFRWGIRSMSRDLKGLSYTQGVVSLRDSLRHNSADLYSQEINSYTPTYPVDTPAYTQATPPVAPQQPQGSVQTLAPEAPSQPVSKPSQRVIPDTRPVSMPVETDSTAVTPVEESLTAPSPAQTPVQAIPVSDLVDEMELEAVTDLVDDDLDHNEAITSFLADTPEAHSPTLTTISAPVSVIFVAEGSSWTETKV